MQLLSQMQIVIWMLVFITKIVANDVIPVEIREVTTESILVVFNGRENITSYSVTRKGYVSKDAGSSVTSSQTLYLHNVVNFLELEKNMTGLDSNAMYRIDVSTFQSTEDINYAPMFIKTLPKASEVKTTNFQIDCVKNDSITIAWDAIGIDADYSIRHNGIITTGLSEMKFSTDKSKVMFELTDLMKNTEYDIKVTTFVEGVASESPTINMKTLNQATDIRNIGMEVFEDSCDLNWLATGGSVTIKVDNDVYVTTNNFITLWNLDRSKTVHTVEINSNSINVTLSSKKRPEINFVNANVASKDSLSIKWEVKRAASFYVLEWKVNDNSGNFKPMKASTNMASITDLQADTEYIVKVSTIIGYSIIRSKPVTLKTLPSAEDEIVNIKATVFTQSVSLVWSDRIPSGKTSYEVSVEGDPTKTITSNKTYATIENIVTSAALHTFTVKAVTIDGIVPAADISGSIQININEKSGEAMYIPSFKLQYGGSNLVLTWEGIKDIYNYTMKYINLNTTETKTFIITSFISISYENQYDHQAFEPQADTLYKLLVETNDDNMKLRSRELIFHKDSGNIQVQVVNVFEDGFDIAWTDEEGLDVSEINIITDPNVAVEFITVNRKEASIWFVAGSTITVSVNLKSTSQNTDRTSEVVVITLSTRKREVIDYFKITEVSEFGLQTYRMRNGNRYAHLEYIFYCKNDENPKNVLKKKLENSKDGNREALVGLKENTKYLVWFESYLFDTSLAKRSKVWTITTLANPAVARIHNLRVVNVYQKSFDVQWDEPLNPEEYELSVTPKAVVVDTKYWGRSASVFLTSSFDTSETEFEVSVHFKSNEAVTSNIVNVTPGKEGNGLARPSLYAWIETTTLNSIQVSWYGNGDSVVYTVNSTCYAMDRTTYKNIQIDNEYTGTSNTFTKYRYHDVRFLYPGTDCIFGITARTLDGTSYFGVEPAEVRGVAFVTNDITEKLQPTQATTTAEAAAGILSPSYAIPFVLTLMVLVKQFGLMF